MEPTRRRRVIIDTDAKNEADDQFAIVHALLSPTLDVRGLVAAHFGTRRSTASMAESREEIDLLLDLMDLTGRGHGGERRDRPAIAGRAAPRWTSPGARLIIAESKLASTGTRCSWRSSGPLTDMASAILLDPEIVDRHVIVIWIGGVRLRRLDGPTPASSSTCRNDIAAANVVFDSGITVWQVPSNVYSQVSVGYAELEEKIGGTSQARPTT